MAITIIHQAPSATEAHIRHTQENVTLHVTPASNLIRNPGTLLIADECLYFFSTVSNTGFAIPYPSIIIHAIARESHVGPSIYCQLEGSLASSEPASNGQPAEGDEDQDDEDTVLELSFVPTDVSSLDTIYENLSYCASLHQDEDADDNMDEDDYYEDDVNDHEGLYADADIQGGYIPKSSSATAIGAVAPASESASASKASNGDNAEVEQVPAIDMQSGEWYTGNADTDAGFELSEQGKVMVNQWNHNQNHAPSAQGKRARQEVDDGGDNDTVMAEQSSEAGSHDPSQLASGAQQAVLARMENIVQDPHGYVQKAPDEEEPGEDSEEDRFKSLDR
ncbi:hypothetical protein BG011_000152 [Mortierella polycephala]|uniref:Regulator of volume decrease after cellular swelling-domain-containing protein n=1 Tax=Mortierella polycephala TaxID=41804 RepID=A0A9P6PM09_9FUNG|nr:hypothetical protein BG011_000152 [Mortierella polycephala]